MFFAGPEMVQSCATSNIPSIRLFGCVVAGEIEAESQLYAHRSNRPVKDNP
jgi:hypothetical protein